VIQTSFIGDAILSTPVFRELKRALPHAGIDLLTVPSTRPLFLHTPHIDSIFTFDKHDSLPRKVSEFIRLVRMFRHRRYDCAIALQESTTTAIMMYTAGIPIRIGFKGQPLLTHPVHATNHSHRRTRNCDTLSPLDIHAYDTDTELFFSNEHRRKAASVLQSHKKNAKSFTLGIAPGSVWATKRWPLDYYVHLVDLCAGFNATVFCIGGRNEKDMCTTIHSRTTNPHVHPCAGALDLLESAALIKELDLLVTNDCAPLHMANAVGTPVFAIFGPTVKRFGFFPYRAQDRVFELPLHCRPCGPHGSTSCPEGTHRCMREITPEIIFSAIEEFMQT
jgi:heptosyltransferase-2